VTSIAGGRHNGAGVGSSDLRAPPEEMTEALGAGWLELWYQPKIGSQTLDLRGAEALIRMRHPQLGIVQPAGFIPRMGARLLPALS
jgi:EAL domain-containing protein (putative c-di-GMP-specific phosphodiesterase class I)